MWQCLSDNVPQCSHSSSQNSNAILAVVYINVDSDWADMLLNEVNTIHASMQYDQ